MQIEENPEQSDKDGEENIQELKNVHPIEEIEINIDNAHDIHVDKTVQNELPEKINETNDNNKVHESILTDDNSVIESEQSGTLNYSEEKETVAKDVAMETDQGEKF